MSRKFESELARRVARGDAPKKRLAVTLFVAVSCAILVASAAYALMANVLAADGGPTVYEEDMAAEDYLILSGDEEPVVTYSETPALDESFLVKRGATFKHVQFDTPGNSPNVYTKYVYVVNIRLKDLSAFPEGVDGLRVCSLEVTNMDAPDLIEVTSSFLVNDVAPVPLDSTAPAVTGVSWAVVDGVLTADVVLPDLSLTSEGDYDQGDQVSVFVMWKAAVTGWDGVATDMPFPDYTAVPAE